MEIKLSFSGVGHSLGSGVISNASLATSLGLDPDWFQTRTGLRERRVCVESENVLSLAGDAVQRACDDAKLDIHSLAHETVLIYIQNGFTHLTPPSGVLLNNLLSLNTCRTLSIDGVCAEPIHALEIAALMLDYGMCERVIICAAADFLPVINPTDLDTAGLFGAGAGALVLESNRESPGALRGIYWGNETSYWDLGVIPVLAHQQEQDGLVIKCGYYEMKGQELAKLALNTVPKCFSEVLGQAGWTAQDLDAVVTHQPNAKLLQMAINRFTKYYKIEPGIVFPPVTTIGNLGPASLLVALSMAKEQKKINHGHKVLLLSFGLGFSYAAAALIF